MKHYIRRLLENLITFARRYRAVIERDYFADRALLIAAHPDDLEHFCAGTIAA